MNLVLRKLLMGGLVAAFVVQTAMVYADDTASTFEPLSDAAVRGRQLWHDRNCQTCHQIHGFGGFLGPDLTNAAKRLTDERLREVLTIGNAQMPAFHLTEDQIFDVAAFLDELAEMGVGVPSAQPPLDPFRVRAAIDARIAEVAPAEPVVRGAAVFKANCTACHVPLQATPLGLQTAPDLTTAMQRLDEAGVRQTISDGRPKRGMASWRHLGEPAIADLVAFVRWLNDERQALADAVGGVGGERQIPWWQFR